MSKEELIDKWYGLGFLEGTTDLEKSILAPLLETMTKYIGGLNLVTKDFGEELVGVCVLPIMNKIISKGGVINDIPQLYNDIVSFLNRNECETHSDNEFVLIDRYVKHFFKKINMGKILINEDGVTVGQLKQFLEGFDDDVKVSDTHRSGTKTISSRITEVLTDTEGVALISQMVRDDIDGLTNETTKSSVAFLMESQASILLDREWNYYFDEGTEVMLDKRMLPTDETWSLLKLIQHIGKKGIVKKISCDLHAYGRGSSYNMDIEFDGELVKNVYAPYIMEYKK